MEIWFKPYESKYKEGCMNAFKSNVPDYFVQEEIAEFENFLDKLVKQDDLLSTYYFVLGTDDRIVGCGGFGDKEDTHSITLAWGLIHRDFHKIGLGKLLLEYRIRQFRQIYPDASLFLDTTQFTYTFFEKFGFETLNITEDFYAPGMHRYDMVLNP